MDAIKNTLAENFGGPADKLGTHQFSLEQVPDQTGKVALITGGSEGVGYACSHTLLSRNISKLFILSVNKEVVDGARKAIAEEMGQEFADRTHWLQCDLSDWNRVNEVTEEIIKNTDRLDILINNGARGIMTAQLTDYGVDRHMAVNHMAHVILTSHLLPLLEKTSKLNDADYVRIVNLASNAHEMAGADVKFDSLDDLNKDYGPNGQYGRSKLAGILYAKYLTKNVTNAGFPKLLANATHPGFVDTKMSREDIHEPYPLGGYGMSVAMAPFKKNNFEGSLSTMFAATVTSKSGEYICPPAVPEPGSKAARDDALGDRLMELTRQIVMEKTKPASKDQGCPFNDTKKV